MAPKIYLAFRFHGNFYHSYRGDTPDELGFGKDIRIIRHILKVLDAYNQRGIPVCGTWDFENYFSLETIMPEHCPDIITSLQRRVREGLDEMQMMSYNNGLITAHTAREFEAAIRRAVTNPQGSGLRDLFGDGYFNMVRPQEVMYTPIHLAMYKALGVDSISLYYSAIPFNGFSNFVPPLRLAERYNPLTLTYPGISESMTLLPCYNIGDLVDHLTLRRWVKGMRKKQLAMENPCDLLLLLDQDADDPIWYGMDLPALVKNRLSTVRGLEGLIEDVLDLDYVEFTTPGRYLKTHPPVSSLSIGQDTADGNYDGLSSWTEKWSNHQLFTGLERARLLELQTYRLVGKDELPEALRAQLDESFERRVKILSTTHFGMAAPVMNLARERIACSLVGQAVEAAATAFSLASQASLGPGEEGTLRLLDYVRGDSTEVIQYNPHSSTALVRLPVRDTAPAAFTLQNPSGEVLPSALLSHGGRRELLFVDRFEPLAQKEYRLIPGQASPQPPMPVTVTANSLQNERLRLQFDDLGQAVRLTLDGQDFSAGQLLNSAVQYGGKLYQVEDWEMVESLSLGVVGVKRQRGALTLKGGFPVQYEREFVLATGLPYLYLTVRVTYPRTPDQGYNPDTARRLQQAWDAAWQAVHPCELRPGFRGGSGSELRVWKHNYCDHLSTFELDYSRFSPNQELTSINNQITSAWVAVSDGQRGLLLAQNAEVLSNVAFCPMRTRREGGALTVRLNPFGTYTGPAYKYGTADTRLGAFLAASTSASSHIRPVAPSYNGRVQEFSLLVAPYAGDAPPASIQYDAEAFAYPYILLNNSAFIGDPQHRSWDGQGLGQPPD